MYRCPLGSCRRSKLGPDTGRGGTRGNTCVGDENVVQFEVPVHHRLLAVQVPQELQQLSCQGDHVGLRHLSGGTALSPKQRRRHRPAMHASDGGVRTRHVSDILEANYCPRLPSTSPGSRNQRATPQSDAVQTDTWTPIAACTGRQSQHGPGCNGPWWVQDGSKIVSSDPPPPL